MYWVVAVRVVVFHELLRIVCCMLVLAFDLSCFRFEVCRYNYVKRVVLRRYTNEFDLGKLDTNIMFVFHNKIY